VTRQHGLVPDSRRRGERRTLPCLSLTGADYLLPGPVIIFTMEIDRIVLSFVRRLGPHIYIYGVDVHNVRYYFIVREKDSSMARNPN
jgi:hypothetical protein